jgi:hypothetical protein
LLFQFPEHLNQYVLGREVKLAQSIYSVASTLTGFSHTLRDGLPPGVADASGLQMLTLTRIPPSGLG